MYVEGLGGPSITPRLISSLYCTLINGPDLAAGAAGPHGPCRALRPRVLRRVHALSTRQHLLRGSARGAALRA